MLLAGVGDHASTLLPIAGCREVVPPSLPSPLPPSYLSPLGQELLLPSQIQSLHLIFSELGMKEGGSERSPQTR